MFVNVSLDFLITAKSLEGFFLRKVAMISKES